MLFDPKWNQPSVAGFKAWLEKQPREMEFDIEEPERCALGQYLVSIGTSASEFRTNHMDAYYELDAIPMRIIDNHGSNTFTFGDVLAEIEKAGQ